MSNVHSSAESSYCQRWLAPEIAATATDQPVVVICGARQTGKSTLLRHEAPFSQWRYWSLDDPEVRGAALRDPAALWAGASAVVIDEVQRAPEILSAVKLAVDEGRCRFALSGSAQLLLMRGVSESLAGRAVYFELLPLSAGEAAHRSEPRVLADLLAGRLPAERALAAEAPATGTAMVRGFMPALLRVRSVAGCVRWWDGYAATYLDRDLRQHSQVDALPDFRRLMRVLALRCGSLLNQSEAARDAGLAQATAHRYARLLEVSGLFGPLPAFARNRTSRLVKAPKAMWLDPGLVAFLCDLHDEASLRAAREVGGIFEALVHLHVRCLAQRLVPRARLHYWRTRTGREVDLVVEHGRRLVALEVKLSPRAGFGDVASLEAFLAEHPEASAGVLIYDGVRVQRLGKRIVALPWPVLAGW